jgi:hypothetical protein
MAEQIDRHSRSGSRGTLKAQTRRERRQMERRVAHDHLGEVRYMRDGGDELDWCDLVSPPARIPYHGWVD